jgi:hypothetical protein
MKKNQYDGGTAIVEAFRKLGVEYILSSPGTEWAPAAKRKMRINL